MKFSIRDLLLVTVIVALAVGGCGTRPVPEVSLAELQQLVNGNHEGKGATVWMGLFYCGTEGDFHFLRNRAKTRPDRLIRIRTSSLTISPVEKYPLDESKWVSVSKLILELDN